MYHQNDPKVDVAVTEEKSNRPIVAFLLRRAEQFVVAHELGHLAAGHVDPRAVGERATAVS